MEIKHIVLRPRIPRDLDETLETRMLRVFFASLYSREVVALYRSERGSVESETSSAIIESIDSVQRSTGDLAGRRNPGENFRNERHCTFPSLVISTIKWTLLVANFAHGSHAFSDSSVLPR